MNRVLISGVLMLAVSFNLAAAGAEIVPAPQKWEPGTETLELETTDLSYYFVEKPNPNNIFALNQLIIFWEANQALRLTPGTRGKADLLVGKLGIYDKLDEAFRQEDIDQIGEEGYIISVTADRIFVGAHTDTGIFYGIQTLRQYMMPYRDRKIPTLYLADWPDFKLRAWQDDALSKGAPETDYIKDQIKKFAQFKLNGLVLETNPALPKNVIDELNRYAGLYHVKLFFNEKPAGELREALIQAEGRIWPDLRGLNYEIKDAVAKAKEAGAAQFLLKTSDENYFGFFESFYLPVIWGGVNLWNVEKSGAEDYPASFNRQFSHLYFSSAAPVSDVLFDFSNLGQLKGLNGHSAQKSWEAYEGEALELSHEELQKLATAMDAFKAKTRDYLMNVSQNVHTFECFQFAVNWSNWMVKKHLAQSYIRKISEGDALPEGFNDQIAGLRRELFTLRQTYQTLWKKERKDKGLSEDLKLFDIQTEATINLPYQVFSTQHPSETDSLYSVGLTAINDTLPIYYTLDGTEPTEESPRYEAPLQLSGTAVLKACTISNRYKGPVSTFRPSKPTSKAQGKAKSDANGMACAPLKELAQPPRFFISSMAWRMPS